MTNKPGKGKCKKAHSIINKAAYFWIFVLIITATGCSLDGGPRARLGCLPTAMFANPDNLGTHNYTMPFTESSGIVYTCRGGSIDLDHIRGNADNTRYLFKKISKTLSKENKGFSFSLTGESSVHKIQFTYPKDWESRPNKDKIIEEIAYGTAPYIAFNATIWHEIMTWYGVHFLLIEPEFNSAFSWEDIYSNMVGITLSVEAMKDKQHSYNEAMTILLKKQLKGMQLQPESVAIRATQSVKGKWWDKHFGTDMKMRNFDIGLDDGFVSPCLIPWVAECGNSQPLLLAAPSLATLKKYGFSMSHEIKPKILLQQGRIFKAANTKAKTIIPEKDFPAIIKAMKKESIELGYKYNG